MIIFANLLFFLISASARNVVTDARTYFVEENKTLSLSVFIKRDYNMLASTAKDALCRNHTQLYIDSLHSGEPWALQSKFYIIIKRSNMLIGYILESNVPYKVSFVQYSYAVIC